MGHRNVQWSAVWAVAAKQPDLSQHARWLAAVLASGPGAVASHTCAGGVWGVVEAVRGIVEVTVPAQSRVRKRGIRAYRRDLDPDDITVHNGVPLTTPI